MPHTIALSHPTPNTLTLHITEHLDDNLTYSAQLTIPAHMAAQLADALDAARDHRESTLVLPHTTLLLSNASSIGPTDAVHIAHTSPSGLLDAITLAPDTAAALALTLRAHPRGA